MAGKPKKRKCSAKTKAGKPCRAKPLRDQDTCLAHSDSDTRGSVGFTPEAGKLGGRPRNPRAIEVLREKIEAKADELIDVYFEAAKAERSYVVGSGDNAELVSAPDHPTRIKAVDSAFDRAFGKPGQALEVTGAGGGPVEINEEAFLNDETRKKLDELARGLGSSR